MHLKCHEYEEACLWHIVHLHMAFAVVACIVVIVNNGKFSMSLHSIITNMLSFRTVLSYGKDDFFQ